MSRRTGLSITIALALGVAVFATASSASGQAAPASQSPPTIAGAAVEGGVLDSHHGRWQSDSSLVLSHQWQRCLPDGTGCVDLPGATDGIYTPGTADVGHTLRVVETATNRSGSATATSAATRAVVALPAAAPHNTAPPTVAGSPVAGRNVAAANGTWTGTAPIRFAYRWRRCSPTGGDCDETAARGRAYGLSGGDVNRSLRVLVIARGPGGTASALSGPTARITKPSAPAPQNRSLPQVKGSPRQGGQLTADRGNWSNSPSGFAYTWLRCDRSGNGCAAIPGAHGYAYTPTSADVGHTLRLQVDARNGGGLARAFSPPTAMVGPLPAPAAASPVNTVRPSIAGTAQEGKTLVGNRGTWTNNPTSYEYAWERCDTGGGHCDTIGSARSTSYTLRSDDVGRTIRFRVRAKNSSGDHKATSNATGVVRASGKPANTSPPTVSGTPSEGATLTGTNGNWTHGPTSFAYTWFRCDRNGNACSGIGGAHASTYRLTSADVGATLRLRVTAANSEGSDSATSVPTAVIQHAAAPPPSRGPGCPAGTANPDQVAGLKPPARLLVDTLQSAPRTVTRGTGELVVRFHVTSTCGRPVQGALVYATATPYNQFSIPPEVPTGADGWATLVFRRLSGFPVSGHQQLIAVFVRARKPGENVLGGISTRRLVSIPVRLG
jgi:hypothetical protein